MVTVEEFNKNLGKRIALYREFAGLTQTELGIKAGYKDRTSIAKMESGLIKIPMKKLAVIAEILNTDIQTLCLIEEEKEQPVVAPSSDLFKKNVLLLASLNDEELEKAYTVLSTMFGGNKKWQQ